MKAKSIDINDVLNVRVLVELGEAFNNSTIATIITNEGAVDVVFTSDGEPVKQARINELIEKVGSMFNKRFEPLTLENIPTWGHFITINKA